MVTGAMRPGSWRRPLLWPPRQAPASPHGQHEAGAACILRLRRHTGPTRGSKPEILVKQSPSSDSAASQWLASRMAPQRYAGTRDMAPTQAPSAFALLSQHWWKVCPEDSSGSTACKHPPLAPQRQRPGIDRIRGDVLLHGSRQHLPNHCQHRRLLSCGGAGERCAPLWRRLRHGPPCCWRLQRQSGSPGSRHAPLGHHRWWRASARLAP